MSLPTIALCTVPWGEEDKAFALSLMATCLRVWKYFNWYDVEAFRVALSPSGEVLFNQLLLLKYITSKTMMLRYQ